MQMKKKIKVQTPAKINLSLEIVDRTENGFHLLSSVMQTVSLYDYLTFSRTEQTSSENNITLTGNSPRIPYDEKNIIYKAIKLYFEVAGIKNTKIDVEIEKNIPVEAGLAGGSTNAAGALIAVNSLFDEALPIEKIHEIAAQLGSDLNFCLEGGVCLLSSRGEIIEEKLPFQKYNILLAKPKDISISTALCYKNFSQKYFEKKNPLYSRKIVELYNSSKFSVEKLSELLYNDLEKPAIDMHCEISNIKEELTEAGCMASLMSGSGSSVFGLYSNPIDKNFSKNLEVFEVETTACGVKIL